VDDDVIVVVRAAPMMDRREAEMEGGLLGWQGGLRAFADREMVDDAAKMSRNVVFILFDWEKHAID